MENYELDPARYYTAPGSSWDAVLFENSIRGEVSMTLNIYSKVDNKYLTDYDSEKPSKYLMYLNAS